MTQYTRIPPGTTKEKLITGPVMHRVNVRDKSGQETCYSFSIKEMAMACLDRMRVRDDVSGAVYLDPEATPKGFKK